MSILSRPTLGSLALAGLLAAGLFAAVSAPRAQDLDLGAVFNCNPDGPLGNQTPEQCLASRGVVLNTCTACHTFVPIVKAQKTPDGWDATLDVHRPRVPGLGDDEFEALREFLKAHFNEQLPPPALPPELEALGTGMPA